MATAYENNVTHAPELTPTPEIGNRFTWEQIAPQLQTLGIQKEHLSPRDLNELLNARRTQMLHMNQADAYGTVTPVAGRLFVYDKLGEGPQVEMIPKALELTPAPRYLGYQLSQEDHIRLMKTGEMGKAVPLVDKQDGTRFMGMIGIDPATNRMTVVRQERFVPPTILRGVAITPKQQQTLKEHGIIRVKNMNGIDGKPFTADVQFSVNNRKLLFKAVNQAALTAKQEQRTTQLNGPQPPSAKEAARMLADDAWRNTMVSTKSPVDGERVRKIAGHLTYGDQIRVNRPKDGDPVYRPLTNVYPGQDLRSPRAQAKQEIMDYRSEQLGKMLPAKTQATAEQIARAIQKFTVINGNLADRPAVHKPATVSQPKESPVSIAPAAGASTAPSPPGAGQVQRSVPQDGSRMRPEQTPPAPSRKGPRR